MDILQEVSAKIEGYLKNAYGEEGYDKVS